MNFPYVMTWSRVDSCYVSVSISFIRKLGNWWILWTEASLLIKKLDIYGMPLKQNPGFLGYFYPHLLIK